MNVLRKLLQSPLQQEAEIIIFPLCVCVCVCVCNMYELKFGNSYRVYIGQT